MLKTRLATVAVVLPLFLAALFYTSKPVWALFLAPLLLVGAWEWGALAGWRPRQRIMYLLLMAALGVLLWHTAGGPHDSARALNGVVLGASVLFWLTLAPLWLARGWHVRAAVPLAVAGLIVLLPLWLALVNLQAQPWILLMLMAIVWISDTAAYFCGRQWGKGGRKLAPAISPGKTWAGVYGAMAAVAVYCVVLNVSGRLAPGVLQGFAGFAVFWFLTALGIEGDLFESWLKRSAGVKDSGTLFPGHGGVLDRFDAMSSSMPAAALVLSLAA
jgi:phosphatidate cytidylyltransferase